MTAEDRYEQDPTFHALTEMIFAAIVQNKYTPTEVRDAAMLAALKYEYAYRRTEIVLPCPKCQNIREAR